MKNAPVRRIDIASFVGVPLALLVIAGAQWLEGGKLAALVQPTAALVVFGGTAAALLVSFPAAHLKHACLAVTGAFGASPAPSHQMIQEFTQYAVKAKRKGTMSLESDIATAGDPFLARALSLLVDGFDAADVRRALEAENRRREEAEETSADVLEAAAGYSPTLGILGAVLGLIHVMENLTAPTKLGAGIAVAFVATVYGVGAANLLFLPLATKLRGVARTSRLTRELVIEATSAIQRGVHPRLLEQHLAAYVRAQEHKQRKKEKLRPEAAA
jgi:chemotaxis protein MotA